MARIWLFTALILVLVVACSREGTQDTEPASEQTPAAAGAEESPQGTQVEQANEATSEAVETVEATEGTGADTMFQGVRNGYFESERFNIRFQWPATWNITSTPADDSITIEGPDGLQMIVANTQSFQLVDANFEELNDRVSFDNVNIIPDRTETRPINGMPGYRVEGDALLRGEDVPIYFISQAVTIPGEPVVATTYIPGENYFMHSDEMKAVLDSIEALNLRPE